MNTNTNATPATQAATLELLTSGAKLPEVVAKINELVEAYNTLAANAPKARDRGPDSTREMTEDDARSVMLGEHKDLSHKEAAKLLGLSYGQIYSARKGFTFKAIYKEMIKG